MKVFCWDFDGTLTRSGSLWGGSIFDILKSIVPNCTDGLCQRVREHMWGHYPWDTPDRDDGSCRDEAWWDSVEGHFFEGCIGCGIPPSLSEEAARLLRPTIKQPARYRLYEDALPTLQALRAHGAKNVLLSNNYPDLEEVADALGLSPCFDGAVISGKVGYNKPRREIFELAKQKYPEAEYIMVGDNPSADILGGKQSGMKTVLVHRGVCGQADFCFEDLKSIIKLSEFVD